MQEVKLMTQAWQALIDDLFIGIIFKDFMRLTIAVPRP